MSMRKDLPLSITHEVRDHCLCLHLQRAARAVARRFDDALRPVGLTNGQFSLLMSLNRPDAATISEIAALLAVDRTTLTANAKPLERRKLLSIEIDKTDRRSRRLRLTEQGRDILVAAMPIWRRTHRQLDKSLGATGATRLRSGLGSLR